MIDVDAPLLNSWMALLDGVISVNVYKRGAVPDTEAGNYVELYLLSNIGDDTKQSFRNDVVLVTDIVTSFNLLIDTSIADGIDNEIKTLVKTTPGNVGLPAQSGIQIVNVTLNGSDYFEEYDSGKKFYRKIVRYNNRIVQQ